MLTVILSVSLWFGPVFAQTTRKELDPKMVPMSGATTNAFVPKSWKTQDEQRGDLNGDGLPDAVLQLIQDLPIPKDEFQERARGAADARQGRQRADRGSARARSR